MTETPVSTGTAAEAPSSPPVESGPSSAQPEATGAASAQPEAASTETKQPTDWRKREAEDPDFKQYVQDAIARARASDRRKALRDKARAATTSTDQTEQARGAIEVARELAQSQEPDETANADFIQKRDKALPLVDRFTQTDEYADLWKKHGKAEMDRRFFADPEEFADWVFDEIADMRANKRAEKRAMDLAKAMATEQTADALRNIPVPMGGSASGGSGGMTLERLFSLPQPESAKWKKEHRLEYDALVAALSS